MNVLLIAPRMPVTYWGFQYSMRFIGKRASQTPLGLITLAGLLPSRWSQRLVDLNLRPLQDRDLRWADVVLVGGMLAQLDSIQEVIRRTRAVDRRVVVGGPVTTSTPDTLAGADVVFQGEAEGRVEEVVAAVENPAGVPVVLAPPAGARPDLRLSPVPRHDLLELRRYASVSLQYSRGCPFSCEFCDVIELFGRASRVKAPAQVLAELDSLRRLGYRGSLFFVDDNFIGNRRAVRELLPALVAWQEEHGLPFDLYTEASVDLAADPELVEGMVRAGFSAVFLGIETPSAEALAAAGKRQNLRTDVAAAVDTLTRAGLEVMGGFIVGFDADGPEIFEAQHRLIRSSPIPTAMVGLLSAMPGTALWRRLQAERRLRGRPSGDQFDRPNFRPAMDEATLLRGYAQLLRDIYSPREYYRRCAAFAARVGRRRSHGRPLAAGLLAFAQAVVRLGFLGRRRLHFWWLLARSGVRTPHAFPLAVALAIKGEHLIRYTERHVLPRLRRALAELDEEGHASASVCAAPRA